MLGIAASVLACAATLACLGYRRRTALLQSELTASRIAFEEREALETMHSELVFDFDQALSKVSEESRVALQATITSIQSLSNEVQLWAEALPNPVLVHRDGIIEFGNKPAHALLLAHAGSLAGSQLETWIGPRIGPCVPASARDKASRDREHSLEREDGTSLSVGASEIPIDFEGSPATLTLLRDLTQERRMEKRLRLADRMTSLGSLVAGIAHELNNPMSYVLANLEMLRDEVGQLPATSEQLREFREMLAEAEEGCMRVSTTVVELQRFSRPPPSGNGGTLSQIIGSACAITGSTIRSHAAFHVEIGNDLVLPEGADQLTHVLVNLLLNAAESIISQEQGKEHNEVNLRAFRQEGKSGDLIIEVVDSGPGISEHLQERIFDPFYTTRHAGKATGLGLPICYSMVAAMGGELEVESELGAGATMRVRLPSELGEDCESG